MKRIQEKVKDLVELRAYRSLQDFIAEPQQTLAVYHFTDITSDLMAKYLDKIAGLNSNNGVAAALAGYRGVGKSHFLATLGAIASHPELRSKVADAHVAASMQRLKRARYPVAYVRRGTQATLLEETKAAIAETFETNAENLGNSLSELLSFAAEKAGELPFLLLVDTAFERVSRVARDDGVLLGEIAETAKNLNIFVAVALDDDIAGADGINAAIARSFTIDYLDQEHLYRIVDANLFPKNRQMLPVLQEIYTNFRELLPNFRWSEQRFSALYPLHPIILEVAPFIRLYAPEFALLGFAAEAGRKILARPANSLIALDEVFDAVENTLRKIEELKAPFAAYDNVNKQFINQISVMQRLQAKLVLKALFLLSLEGEGTTAGEIGAAMLIYDENEPPKAVKMVEELLENFAAAFPAEISKKSETGREIRYSLKIGGADKFNNALAEIAKTISPAAVVPKVLRRAAREKFSDWALADENTVKNSDLVDFSVIWRGSRRRGQLIWNLENNPNCVGLDSANSDLLDWEIIITASAKNAANSIDSTVVPKIFWQPAPLRAEETDAILRYYVLLSDNKLREEYGEQIRAAAHSHVLTIEKIWNRVFLQEARIVIDGFEYKLPEEAQTAENLENLLSNMLEPLFEARFPSHPYFLQTLDAAEVSALVSDFFGGARQNQQQSQQSAETFGLPLGLVALCENAYVIETEENLAAMNLTGEVLQLVRENPEKTVSLRTISSRLKQSPYGLVNEAQHLILAALVAQRQIEFVTAGGDRINRRSLDLKIIWEDIEGVARPSGAVYSNERLTEWARILTGSDVLHSIDAAHEQNLVRDALQNWLNDWRQAKILQRFAELPDEILNTEIWRLAAHAEKSFGAVAAAAAAISDESISLDEGLHRVADAFSDSEKEFFARTRDLIVLEDFIGGVPLREKIWNYLAVCENTRDEKTEYLRDKLAAVVEESYKNPSQSANSEMENLWGNFLSQFSEHFALKHDLVMKSRHLQEKFDEILRGDRWWEFENLSQFKIFQKNYYRQAQKILRRLERLDCRFEVREMLKNQPFCACSFDLTKIRDWENLPAALEQIIEDGQKFYLQVLRRLSETIIPLVKQFSSDNNKSEQAARRLIEVLKNDGEHELLRNEELIILKEVFENLPAAALLNSAAAVAFAGIEQTDDFFNELPNAPVLLKM